MKPRWRPLGSGKTGRVNKPLRERTADGETLRTCNACDAEKPLGEFPRDPSGPGGRKIRCYACWRPRHAAYERQRRALDRSRSERVVALRRAP